MCPFPRGHGPIGPGSILVVVVVTRSFDAQRDRIRRKEPDLIQRSENGRKGSEARMH